MFNTFNPIFMFYAWFSKNANSFLRNAYTQWNFIKSNRNKIVFNEISQRFLCVYDLEKKRDKCMERFLFRWSGSCVHFLWFFFGAFFALFLGQMLGLEKDKLFFCMSGASGVTTNALIFLYIFKLLQ